MATPGLKKTILPPPLEKKKGLMPLHSPAFLQGMVFLFFFLIVFLSFLYLSHFNEVTAQGGIIHDLELKRSELMRQNEVWRQRITNLKSLDVLEQQDVVKKMSGIEPSEIQFIDASPRAKTPNE